MAQFIRSACQPDPDEFSQDQWDRIYAIICKYKKQPGALIPVLEEIQDITGYLPESVQRCVSTGLDIPLSQVYGVVTFYSFFTMVPKGKYKIRVCLGTACHVRGGQRILDEIEKNLNLEPGGCTPNRDFSLDVVRCIGACGVSPVMVVNDDIHKQVKSAKVSGIINTYKPASSVNHKE